MAILLLDVSCLTAKSPYSGLSCDLTRLLHFSIVEKSCPSLRATSIASLGEFHGSVAGHLVQGWLIARLAERFKEMGVQSNIQP